MALPDKPAEPKRRRVVVTDTSSESLVADLAGSPDGAFAYSDELATILGALDNYSKRDGVGRSRLLSIWAASPISTSRLSRTANCLCERPFMPMFGSIQPSRLQTLGLSDNDGLAARFLWALPQCRVVGLGTDCPAGLFDEWAGLVALCRATTKGVFPVAPHDIALIDRQFLEWKSHAQELDRAGRGLLAGTFGKAPDQFMRLLALLYGLNMVSATTNAEQAAPPPVGAAVRLTNYFLAHTTAVFRLVVGTSPRITARKLTEADTRIISAIVTLFGNAKEARTQTAGEWAEELNRVGVAISPEALGRVFTRINADGCAELTVARPDSRNPRGKLWTITTG